MQRRLQLHLDNTPDKEPLHMATDAQQLPIVNHKSTSGGICHEVGSSVEITFENFVPEGSTVFQAATKTVQPRGKENLATSHDMVNSG
jgi:hypothetical protein